MKSNYIKGATWVNDGKAEKVVSGEDLDGCLKKGWSIGMLSSLTVPKAKKDK